MQKRCGETLVEVLIAFVIIIIAISISVVASSTVVGLKTEARIKGDIFDIVYSRAEEQLSTSTILPTSTITRNTITYSMETISASTDITFKLSDDPDVTFTATVAILTVYPVDFEDKYKYKITMTVYPKQ